MSCASESTVLYIQGASRTELARKKDLPSQEFLQAFINAYQSNRVLYEPLDHKGSGHSFNRKPFQEWEPGHEKPECKVEVPADKYHNPQVSKNQFQVGITCHHCGEEGHIRPNCPKMPERPKKVRMVATENDCDKFEPVSGMVNGSPAQIALDSGAEFCIVSEELSKGAEVVPRTVLLNWFTADHVIKAPVCRVNVEVMGRQVNCEAAIVPNIEDEFILGLNVGKRMLAELIHAAAFQPHKVGITRLQEKKRQQMEQQCAILDEASGAVPSPRTGWRLLRWHWTCQHQPSTRTRTPLCLRMCLRMTLPIPQLKSHLSLHLLVRMLTYHYHLWTASSVRNLSNVPC